MLHRVAIVDPASMMLLHSEKVGLACLEGGNLSLACRRGEERAYASTTSIRGAKTFACTRIAPYRELPTLVKQLTRTCPIFFRPHAPTEIDEVRLREVGAEG
jgi:hypothetical protein